MYVSFRFAAGRSLLLRMTGSSILARGSALSLARNRGGRRTQQHAEQVSRIVGIGEQIEVCVIGPFRKLTPDVAEGREVLHREPARVEQGDLARVLSSGGPSRDHLPQLGHGMIVRKLLDLTLDTALGRVLDKDGRAQKHVWVQLGFAGAVAPNAVYMNTCSDEVVGQDGGILLVGGDRRDDSSRFDRLDNAGAPPHVKPRASEVAQTFGGGSRIDVVEAHTIDAEQSLER
jgi:hypothetical protein